MKIQILIAGSSGFIGKKLVEALAPKHAVTVLGRNRKKLEKCFAKTVTCVTWDELNELNAQEFEVVINLCGTNIAAARWTEEIKQQLITSRVNTSQQLIDWILTYAAKPHFICANAVGIYGMHAGDKVPAFDENSEINFAQPQDFLSEICIRWQQVTQTLVAHGIPVTITRFGVVLGKGEGMLKKLAWSFYLGMGAIIGTGQQIISWIDIDDVVGAIVFLVDRPELNGAFNLTAPSPVSQAEFARTYAKVLNRPLWLTMPACLVRLLFGEMGESLLLQGQKVLPKRLIDSGYKFKYPALEDSLRNNKDVI